MDDRTRYRPDQVLENLAERTDNEQKTNDLHQKMRAVKQSDL